MSGGRKKEEGYVAKTRDLEKEVGRGGGEVG